MVQWQIQRQKIPGKKVKINKIVSGDNVVMVSKASITHLAINHTLHKLGDSLDGQVILLRLILGHVFSQVDVAV